MTERVRSRVESVTTDWWKTAETQQSTLGSQPVTADTSGSYTENETYEEMTDVVTPRYKQISANGGIVNSPMSKVKTITRDNLCYYKYLYSWEKWYELPPPDDPGQWGTFYHAYEGVFPSSDYLDVANDLPQLPSYDEQAKIDQAVAKAWAATDVTELQSLVTLAEGKKTVLSLISIFTRLIKILKKIKRLDIKGLMNELSAKELSDRYMELRYALRPLVYEVKGVAAALQTEAGTKPNRLTFRGITTYQDDDVSTVTIPVTYSNFAGVWDYDIVRTTKWERNISVRAGVLTQLEQLNSLNIWGMTQPVESLWELVPFSFVVDWFFNVGDVLSAWTPNYGLKALASWYVVEKREYQFLSETHTNCETTDTTEDHNPLEYQRTMSNLWYDLTTISKVRVPNPQRPILPTWNMRLDTWKLTDLVIIAKKVWR